MTLRVIDAPVISAANCLLTVAEGWSREQGDQLADGGRRYDVELSQGYLLAVVWQPSGTWRYDAWSGGRLMRDRHGDATPWLTLERDEAVQLIEGMLV